MESLGLRVRNLLVGVALSADSLPRVGILRYLAELSNFTFAWER